MSIAFFLFSVSAGFETAGQMFACSIAPLLACLRVCIYVYVWVHVWAQNGVRGGGEPPGEEEKVKI